eukprot:8483189-Alexandrium_andersonii.AAC.1
MSASLVGSEMCIRDRDVHDTMIPLARFGTRRLMVAARAAHVQVDQRPVSYTHLTLPTICSV